MNDGSIVQDINKLYSKCRHFGDENTSECIRDGSVEANEREGGIECFIFMELDVEGLNNSVSTTSKARAKEISGISYSHPETSFATIHATLRASDQGSLWKVCW